MAKKKKDSVFIRQLGSDILKLQQLLEKYSNRKVDSSFRKIKASLDKNQLKYDSGVLVLYFNDDEMPRHLSHKNIKELRISFSTELEIDYNNLIKNNDPFKNLKFNIYVEAEDLKTNKEIIYSFHLDRHIFKKGDGIPNEVHPMYHFQFGGDKLKEKVVEYGQALFFDTPRISYHPMDFILGLDFLLSNFFPNIWRALQTEGNYLNIIRRYQEYFMKPYYQAIANSFDRTLPQNWNAKEIYPQLIGR